MGHSLEVGDAFWLRRCWDNGLAGTKCRVGAGEFVEPVVALAEEFGVHRVVDVVLQSLGSFPRPTC